MRIHSYQNLFNLLMHPSPKVGSSCACGCDKLETLSSLDLEDHHVAYEYQQTFGVTDEELKSLISFYRERAAALLGLRPYPEGLPNVHWSNSIHTIIW